MRSPTGPELSTVVVYKVDRLTRSLADFAKLVELFDAEGGLVCLSASVVQHVECGRALASARVIQMIPGELRGPILEHLAQAHFSDVLLHELGHVGDAVAANRRSDLSVRGVEGQLRAMTGTG